MNTEEQAGTPFSRAVVPLERWFLAHPPTTPILVQICVEGFGLVDVDELRRAVGSAARACPGSRLALRGNRWEETGSAPQVRVVDLGPGDRVEDAAELRRPLATGGCPASEVLLFRGERATVVFRAAHAVMDARGLLMWATETFRVLRGEPARPALATDSYVDLLARFGIDPGAAPLPANWPSVLGPPVRGPNTVIWRRRTVDGAYPALVARLATVINELSGPAEDTGGNRFEVTVDLRRYLPDVRSTGNLSRSVFLDVPAGTPWDAVHGQLLTALTDRQDLTAPIGPGVVRAPLPLLRTLIRLVDARSARRDRFPAVATLSHLGRIDMELFRTNGFEPLSVYALPSTAPAGPPEIDLVECDGHTELTVVWRAAGASVARIDDLLDRLVESLSPAANRNYAGNDTARPPKDARSVVARFRDQVRERPDAVAVSGPEGRLTYAELAGRSDAVARDLVARGVGRETVVGVLAEHSFAAVVGVWGVLKAGAAYQPLDVHHPDPRIFSLLDDSGAAVCLVQRSQAGRDCVPVGCARVVLDDLPHTAEPVDIDPAPGDLAYVIYTSGSTGKPKGVEVEHGSVLNYASWACREHDIDADARLPLITSLSFDVAGISLLLPFLVGGTLLLMRDELSHLSLREVFEDRANVLALTPTHLDLINRLDLRPTGVRSVVVAGEEFRRSVAVRAREVFGPACRVHNMYGPTETTIALTNHVFDETEDTAAALPIGLPMDNVTVHLLDAERRFVPPGEVGEVYLGGVQVARGYRGRPDLTSERFVRLADGSRVYRTGDLARLLPSGEIEFAGRIDDQVKVHGFRVEPAEIAQALESHPSVVSAVVVVRSGAGEADRTLCGYVLVHPGADPVESTELLAYLGERLPAYLVPSAVLVVDDIPRTINGKVDASALPDPFAVPGEPVERQAPRDDVEDAIAKVWSRALGIDVDRFGSTTDFHRLGGDSLSLLTMVAEVVREVVGVSGEEAFTARLAELIRCPTIERIAEVVRECRVVE